MIKRILATSFLSIVGFASIAYYYWYKPKFKSASSAHSFSNSKINIAEFAKLKNNAAYLKKFATAHGYYTNSCFIVDMSISSGKKRFFVYNLLKDSVEYSGLVTHGSGSDNASGNLKFSNTPGGYCTSLGKYKIAGSYKGRFGLAYKLYGLDKTNNNAYARAVVLHSHSCVPDEEISPLPICKSLGCPTVSPAFLMVLKTYIEKTKQPILLDIVEN